MNLYSYVVRYDSGFAPNPFYGCCSLATCKPMIRKAAQVGDWVVGSGSAAKAANRGGTLVYAMEVSEILTFEQYFADKRFTGKKPVFTGSKKQVRGDNIYFRCADGWNQLNSFHSNEDGSRHADHVARDTAVNRVLVSFNYVYFGANGPEIPLFDSDGKQLCHARQGMRKFDSSNPNDCEMINDFLTWLRGLEKSGYVSRPLDW